MLFRSIKTRARALRGQWGIREAPVPGPRMWLLMAARKGKTDSILSSLPIFFFTSCPAHDSYIPNCPRLLSFSIVPVVLAMLSHSARRGAAAAARPALAALQSRSAQSFRAFYAVSLP